VVSTEEARELAAGKPESMLHVVRAEIDFPEGQNPYADEVYAKAVENFKKLQESGALVRESEPCVFLYRQQMGEHIQTGVVAVSHVDDYDAGKIKRHERTRVAKENDRTRLTKEMGGNAGPVFLTYRDDSRIHSLVDGFCREEPLYDLTAPDGIRHTVWRIPGGTEFVEAFKSVDSFYIADGHHRAASAARVARESRDSNPNHTGEEDYNWFLTVLFPATELKILAYNRLVLDKNGLSDEEIIEKISKVAEVRPNAEDIPAESREIRFYLGGTWYGIRLEPEDGADPVSSLDVSLLQDRILAPIFGIGDPRTDDRIEFVGGIRGTEFLEKKVDDGSAGIAFSLYPVLIEQLMDIADADAVMPPKSTWFEPKLRSGFAVHTFEA
tara:strand:+ start:18845 stop:19993 length:1149 start_codon:yes stop_codon:yes gene_type:complete